MVDDDADVRLLLREVLEENSYFVLTAADGEKALRLLQEHPVVPDVIILDMMMPGMDGWEFLARKHEDPRLADIPVILCTGLDVDRARPGCHEDVLLVLQKPCTPDTFLRVLSHVRRTGKHFRFKSDPPPT